MKANLKINGQQTVKVGVTQRSGPIFFLSLAVNLNGAKAVQGVQHGRII
jgi:hypothetical protein